MPTNEPPPAATMCGTACFRQSMVPTTLRCRVSMNWDVCTRWYGPRPREPPALATTPSRWPVGSSAVAIIRCTSASSVTSPLTNRTLPPWPVASAAAAITVAACAREASVRPEIVTAAPSAANRAAHARPIPVPPPVMSTAEPSRPPLGDVWFVMATDGSPARRCRVIRKHA